MLIVLYYFCKGEWDLSKKQRARLGDLFMKKDSLLEELLAFGTGL